MKLVAIDFEYKRPSEPDMGLISCSLCIEGGEPESFWLWDGSGKEALVHRLKELREHVFVGYSIQQAEARCFCALGLNPNDYKWRDLMLEWRWLRNGDNRFSYGKVIVNGFPRETFPPKVRVGKKASREEEDFAKAENEDYLAELKEELDDDSVVLGMSEAGWSMLDCCFFFETIGFSQYASASKQKKEIRDEIIVQGTVEQLEEYRDDILAYNEDDIKDIIELAHIITEKMCEVGEEDHITVIGGEVESMTLDKEGITKCQLNMGAWAARLAKYAHRGLPIHRKRLNRLLEVVPRLQQEAVFEWNREHPDTPLYRIGLPRNMLEAKAQPTKQSPYIKGNWTKDGDMMENLISAFLEQSGLEAYPRTKSGKPDTSKKVIDRYASGENLLKQYQRHQGHLSALKTYSVNKQGHVEALDYIGSDDKQRPDFGPYGTQTARNGAKAKSLCFLGPHWLRILIDPEPGMCVIDLDYGSQEVFIAGSISGDENLKKAYLSNDVYMYYAQLTGMYPKHLPIPTEEQRSEDWFKPYKKVRSISKTLNLSMQFGAGAKAVAAAVRDATKDMSITDDQGYEWVDDYRDAYSDYNDITKEIRETYLKRTGIMLSDGWRMGPDNPSPLSAGNLPIQGLGSVILRRACDMMDKAGITVIATLHDAITLYCNESEADDIAKKASRLMELASQQVLGESGMKVGAPEIIRHGELWLHSDRAQSAWDKLKENFEDIEVSELF
jgi:hypothetical protein